LVERLNGIDAQRNMLIFAHVLSPVFHR